MKSPYKFLSTIDEDTTLALRCMYNTGMYYPSSPVKFFFNLGVLVLPPPPINKVMVFVYAKKGIDTRGILRDKNAHWHMTEGVWDKRSILPALGKILQQTYPSPNLK